MRNYSGAKHFTKREVRYDIIVAVLVVILIFEVVFGIYLWNCWQNFLDGLDAGLVDWLHHL